MNERTTPATRGAETGADRSGPRVSAATSASRLLVVTLLNVHESMHEQAGRARQGDDIRGLNLDRQPRDHVPRDDERYDAGGVAVPGLLQRSEGIASEAAGHEH